MFKSKIILLGTFLFPFCALQAQDTDSMEDILLGVWKMEPRILRRENYVAYQEEAIIAITGRLPDGRYTILARMTSRVVAEVEGLIDIPGCEDK
jgi:hypothetical protein